MKGRNVVHSSKSDEWGTPQPLFNYFHERFNFVLDAAASKYNRKCPKYYSISNSALLTDWSNKADTIESVWINPPYSLIYQFVEKVAVERIHTGAIVMLVPARTDTKWFHLAAKTADRIYLIKGRLKFKGAGNQGAPFPSCVIIWNGDINGFRPDTTPFKIELLELSPQQRGFE